MYGGGMRQAGILAAAGLYAIEHHRARLVDDHANARWLAIALEGVLGLSVDVDRVDTNIVMVDLDPPLVAGELATRARARGVRVGVISAHRLRLVTHLDVDRAGCQRAVEVLAAVAAEAREPT
jgi:threonine aldolase